MRIGKVEIVETDKRRFEFNHIGFWRPKVYMPITQLDILRIMRMCSNNGSWKMYKRFKKLITAIDEITGEKTDFDRQLPRRDIR